MECFVKAYKIENGVMVAACDEDIIGKTFTEGKLTIDVKVEFYGQELKGTEELKDLLKNASMANLTGENAVACGITEGLIENDSVIHIKGIPHAQMVRL